MVNNGNSKNHIEYSYFLTSILGNKVIWNNKKIGNLGDMAIQDGDIAEVTHFYITRSFGYPSLLVPWEKVKSVNARDIVIDIEELEKYQSEPAENMILLRDHVPRSGILWRIR